jgi:hypothetical protein
MQAQTLDPIIKLMKINLVFVFVLLTACSKKKPEGNGVTDPRRKN